MRKKTIEQFINDAVKVHGYKYDYSKVKYINCRTKVEIICKKHGSFYQNVYGHLYGQGCPLCAGVKKKTIEQFILDAKKIHGNKYDYSNVKYINSRTKVEIICKKHGTFLQTPSDHINSKSGCPICYGNAKKTTEKFILDAIKVHGDKYDYSKVKYKNIKTKVEIICKDHGSFYQNPNDHLNGHGCQTCSCNKKSNTEQFINDARKIHGNKYDYSNVNYINNKYKVEIICKKHGSFYQTPSDHINSRSGCPICSSSKGELAIKKYLDEHNMNYEQQKQFNDCVNINKLPFDFYLPDAKTFIEYHGRQHYKYVDFFYRSIEDFKNRIKIDKIKKQYALDNGTYLEIRYNDNVAEVLDRFFME